MKSALKQYVSWSVVVATALIGCGKFEKSDRTAADLDQNALEGEEIILDLKADYKLKPVDVVVAKESSPLFVTNDARYPFKSRLFQAVNQPVAFKELAVRLFNSDLDLQLGVMQTSFPDRNNATANSGTLLGDAEGKNFVMKPKAGFIDMSFLRLGYNSNYQANNTYPMTSIVNLINKSKLKDNPSFGVIRKDALLSILFVGISDELDESYDWSAIRDLLDKEKGAGNWVVSALYTPKDGCAYKFNDPAQPERYTNGDDPVVRAAYVRRNKVVSLQEASGGLFESICVESYIDFMTKYAGQGTRSAFFDVKFERAANPATIEVTVNDSPVEGWQYRVDKQTLLVPTSIKSGTKFLVRYRTLPTVETVTGSDGSNEKIDKIGAKDISPAELAFINDGIQGILQKYTCNNCHTGTNYTNFKTAYDNGFKMFERMSRTPGTTGHMPQTRDANNNPISLTTEELGKFKAWVDSF